MKKGTVLYRIGIAYRKVGVIGDVSPRDFVLKLESRGEPRNVCLAKNDGGFELEWNDITVKLPFSTDDTVIESCSYGKDSDFDGLGELYASYSHRLLTMGI